MLTKEAWNAFLKTLEEPPPRTVFVLATTESHKVMPTIADRCQRFDFQRPSIEQISEVLDRVADSESIKVEPGAVAMIARSAQGSFRDALGTLDQLVAFGGDDVGLDEVLEMLGAADADLLFEAVDAVVASDPREVLLGVEKMARSGRDPSQFARDLLAHLRHLLVTQTTGEVPSTFVVTATDTARIQQQAQAVGAATLVRTIDELAAALSAVREGDDARMAVEIALLKAARPDLDPSTEGLLRRIERLEAQLAGSTPPPPAPPVPQPPAPERTSEPTPSTPHPSRPEPQAAAPEPPAAEAPEPSAPEPEPAPPVVEEVPPVPGSPDEPATPDAEPVESPPPSAAADPSSLASPPPAETTAPPPETPPAPPPGDLVQVQRIWPTVLDKLAEKAPALAATFDGARPVAFAGDDLTIGFPPDQPFNKRKAESPDRRQALIDAFAAVAGGPIAPLYVLLEEDDVVADAPPPDTPAPGSGEIDEDELLERLKSEFDAEEVS
jgi:DNA polymerase-3 subunit gamma/tau